MSGVKPKYPLDLTGRNPDNLVPSETVMLLNRGNTPYRVVSFDAGGFYTKTLKVYDSTFKPLIPKQDFIATHTHVDVSDYTGMEVASAVVILNPDITGVVVLNAQVVGGDMAFSTTTEEDTIAYLEGLPVGEIPTWGGYIGDYPQWQPGELQEALWERHHYGHLNMSLEEIVQSINRGNGEAEDEIRNRIKQAFQDFIDSLHDRINQHIADTDKPHPLDKRDVGLGLVENYQTATVAQAGQGNSNSLYLTPKTMGEIIRLLATVPLNNHIAERHTTHHPTADQVGTYTKPVTDQGLSVKVGVSEKVGNANGVRGYLASSPSQWMHFSQAALVNEVRQNLDAANLTSGRVKPAHLGVGLGSTPAHMYLGGDGVWRNFLDAYSRVNDPNTFQMYYAGVQQSEAVALNNIRNTYANIGVYRVGTFVFFRISTHEYNIYDTNNGGNTDIYAVSTRVAIRTAGGWMVLS